MRTRILVTVWLGLFSAGCQGTDSRNVPVAAQPADLVCAGYGVSAPIFNDCVAYQQSRDPGRSVPPYRLDQYNNRVDAEGYAVDSLGRRMPVQAPYYAPWGQASQPVLRDEYGNRYDARGNRI